MANLIDHARDELERAKVEPEVIDEYLKVIEAMAEMMHTGQSVEVAGPIIYTLLQNKNLTPLTDEPTDWRFITNGLWQSLRNPDAYSSDGGKSYTLVSEGGAGRRPTTYDTERG